MQIIEGTTQFQLAKESAAAIGKFDGIHRGHEVLLKHILEQKKQGRLAAVFTFQPSVTAFFGRAEEKELTTLSEKRRYFAGMGVDILIEFPFNKETAAIDPESFVRDVLAGQMNAGFIAAGADISFGAGGRGNQKLLKQMAKESGFQVEIIDKVMYQGQEISSTLVRERVESADMETVAELLGRSYSIEGVVEEGKKLGRKLGMPTLNLYPPKDKLLPPRGVYFSLVECMGKNFQAITNIGHKPTVNDTPLVTVESYLYDYEGDMYGQEIVTKLLHFKRPEMKFPGVSALKAQMEADIEAGRKFHENTIK